MKIRHSGDENSEKIELQMTPMIDIVFQLLVFFIMTFKIVEIEGDFNIKMPLAQVSDGTPDDNLIPPMKLRLRADANGRLAAMFLNEQSFSSDAESSNYEKLNGYIFDLVGGDDASDIRENAEVEIIADYGLKYEETVKAITAVTGLKDPATDEVIKLIEKVKFAPPTPPESP